MPTEGLLGPVRYLVTGVAVASGALLVTSLLEVWWVIEDWEREETLTTQGTAGLPFTIVVLGLLCVAGTVHASQGDYDWAPVVLVTLLVMLWPLLGIGYFVATGETVDSDASGEPGFGLALATLAMALLTLAALVGSLTRLAQRIAHTTSATTD
jgi:hypothetical protein